MIVGLLSDYFLEGPREGSCIRRVLPLGSSAWNFGGGAAI
jgi:hypothetical protein